MFNIVYSEFLKLKKSYIIIIALIGAVFMPVIKCIATISEDYSDVSNVVRNTIIKNQVASIEVASFQFLYIVLFSLIAAYIFSREFTDKTVNILHAYPVNRTKIFIGKLITVYILILFIYAIQFIAIYLSLYIAWGQIPSNSIMIKDIKVNIYSALLQFLLIPIPILIGNITKNILFSVVYGILGAISSMFIMMTGIYMQVSPLMLPALPIYYFHRGDPIDYVLTTSSAVITFAVFIFLSIYQYKNIDMN